MENRKLRLIAFGVLSLVLLSVPVWLILNRESVMAEGRDFKFRTAPIDPYDPFRGKYINLSFDQTRVEAPHEEAWQRGETVFLQVREGSDGFAEVFAPSRERPVGVDDYITATVDYASDASDHIAVRFPFDRYYMKETKALEAERMYFDSSRDTLQEVYAVVSVFQGESVLKSVMIDGVPIEDLVEVEPQ